MWMGRIPNDSIGAIRDGSLFRGRYEAIVVDGEGDEVQRSDCKDRG